MMQSNLEKAKEILKSGNYTCVVTNGDKLLTSTERGVKPLLLWLESEENLIGYVAADKVVGKAAAFIYVLLGVSELYADVMSKLALGVLEGHGIKCTYGVLVDAIRNRTNTGFCPMEQAVKDISNPIHAVAAVKETLKKLTTN